MHINTYFCVHFADKVLGIEVITCSESHNDNFKRQNSSSRFTPKLVYVCVYCSHGGPWKGSREGEGGIPRLSCSKVCICVYLFSSVRTISLWHDTDLWKWNSKEFTPVGSISSIYN